MGLLLIQARRERLEAVRGVVGALLFWCCCGVVVVFVGGVCRGNVSVAECQGEDTEQSASGG